MWCYRAGNFVADAGEAAGGLENLAGVAVVEVENGSSSGGLGHRHAFALQHLCDELVAVPAGKVPDPIAT